MDFLLLADGAQIAGDKLYVLGGGWTVVWARDFPVTHPASLAIGMMVDWQETNQKHSIEVVLVSGDGEPVGEALVKGDFEVGRPPGIPQGASQRFMIAANVNLTLETPGPYEAIVRVDGSDVESASFTAVPATQPVASG
jgi:hypothetical protein